MKKRNWHIDFVPLLLSIAITTKYVIILCSDAQLCLICCDLMYCSLPGSSVSGFPRQEYWSGLPFSPPGNPGIEPESLASPSATGGSFTTSAPWGALHKHLQLRSVQSLSRVWLFATPWSAARQASLSITNSQSPHKPMSIGSVMPSNHLILCRPLLLLPSIFPSIRIFSYESALRIRWPKYWSFSLNISPSNEHPGLISFRMDWVDLPAAQGTLKSLLQHHSSKACTEWSEPER